MYGKSDSTGSGFGIGCAIPVKDPGRTVMRTRQGGCSMSNTAPVSSGFAPSVPYDENVANATPQRSGSATQTIVIAAVNEAPVNTLPASFAASEDSPLVLAGLSVADADSGADDLRVTLTVSGGRLTLATDVAGGLAAGQVS